MAPRCIQPPIRARPHNKRHQNNLQQSLSLRENLMSPVYGYPERDGAASPMSCFKEPSNIISQSYFRSTGFELLGRFPLFSPPWLPGASRLFCLLLPLRCILRCLRAVQFPLISENVLMNYQPPYIMFLRETSTNDSCPGKSMLTWNFPLTFFL